MPHRNNFDALRLTGALLVLGTHQTALSGHQFYQTASAFNFSTLGVAIFFAISGFLVYGSWLNDPHIGRFALRRALRLWPALAVLVVTTTLVLLLFPFDDPLPYRVLGEVYWRNLFADYLDYQLTFAANPYKQLNGSLWTIPVEIRCYAALGALCLVLRKHIRWAALLTWLALAAIPTPIPGALFLVALFTGGVTVRAWPVMANSRCALFAAVVGAALWGSGADLAAVKLALPSIAAWAGSASWPIVRRAGRFGDLSYGIYLWAWPAQQVGVVLFGLASPWLLGATLGSVLPIAWMSWHLVERPALTLKPRDLADANAAEERLKRTALDRVP